MRAATFTTYINAQTDPGLEQAFSRQAQIATSSYATITRAAEQATRATAGLLGARGTTGAGQGTQAIQQRASAIRQMSTAAAEGERASIRLATASRREAEAISAAARQHRQLAGSLTTTATALNVVSGRLDPVSSRVSTLARAVTDLTGVQLGLAAFGATLFAIGRTANTYANLEARVRPFFKTQKDVNAAMNDIIGIASRSRSALEPVVDVYTRLTTVGQNIGLTRQGIGRITEIATKAANVGGGSAQARDAALMQFGQALSGDFKAAGQEINSLKEQAPILFQAILKGYKDVDGTIGVSLGRFRQLAEQSKLSTAGVLDAIERSSGFINDMASRVPNTLSRAGTEFSNSLTITVGKFDQAIGLTSTLADGLSLVARNLRVIVALAAGAGTAFAAVKLTGLVVDGVAAVRQTQIMSAAIAQLSVRRKEAAAASLAQHQREVVALNAEQAEIRQNIALMERQRAVAARDVARYQPGPGYAGSTRLAARAADEERAAVRALSAERQRLAVIQGATVAANGRVTASTKVLETATANVRQRVGLLRSGLSSLVGFLGGPWGIAFAVATTAVYLLATAQSAAAKAADQMRDSQATLAQFIDRTTGRVIEQNSQLVRNRVLQTEDRRNTARQGFTSATLALRKAGDDAIAGFGIGGQDIAGGARAAIQRLTTSGSASDLRAVQAAIDKVRSRNKKVARQLDDALTGFVEAARPLSQANAEIRLLQGKPRDANDTTRAYGERPSAVKPAPTALTAAQINARAQAEAAQTDLQRARANLAEIRANGKNAGETDVDYQHRLAAAMQGVTAAQKAQSDATKAASAARAQARKDARDAITDARDEAAAKRDAALLDLSKQGLNPNSEAFLQARIKILSTYDEEVNKLDASRAASSSAASQMIADANKVAAAAATAGEKRRDILAQYDDVPKALDQAADKIDDLQRFVDTAVDGIAFIGKTKAQIEEIKKVNPLGTGIYTQEMADADARRIDDGVRRPFREALKEYSRAEDVARLQLQGRDAEAAALQRRNSLLDSGVILEESEYETLIRNERQQLRINDALASRQRVVSQITGALDSARDTAEGVFTALRTGADFGDTFENAYKDFRNQFARIQSRQLVERLFAGSDEKLRALLEGKSSVDTAIDKFGTSVDTLTVKTTRVETAAERIATALENSANRVEAIPGAGAGALPAGGGTNGAGTSTAAGNGFAAIAAAGLALVQKSAAGTGSSGSTTTVGPDGEVVVTAPTRKPATPLPQSNTPTARQVYNNIGSSLFRPVAQGLDSLVNKVTGAKTTRAADGTVLGGSTFFKKIGDSFGSALEGAGKGAIASGFAQALGVKQSQAGAQIGGAVGQLAFGPLGGIVGGLLGGTIGGLFQKAKYGNASVSLNQYGEAVGGTGRGRGDEARAAATGSAKSVADGINQIAAQLGATITNLPNITIGSYDGKARVSTSGQTGELSFGKKNKQKDSLIDFGKDGEAAAIEFAIRYSVSNAVINGISQASKNIIKSGQDLQMAIQKAVVIESIPKRLMQLTDPVRYAVTTLNDEFAKMISYLKEGGATAEQFADAQKLYDLERANAIQQATQQAASQIDQFLKDMVGGSNSPLNKRTTYENAASELGKFKADIAAGKTVDQNDLLSAARNFQDASRAMNGSSKSFFDDFDMLRALLQKARDNAGMTDVTTLPGSPFGSDSKVQESLSALQRSTAASTADQTAALSSKLDEVISAIGSIEPGYGRIDPGSESALRLLPGVR